jgi:hypothetical protein
MPPYNTYREYAAALFEPALGMISLASLSSKFVTIWHTKSEDGYGRLHLRPVIGPLSRSTHSQAHRPILHAKTVEILS